MIEGALRVLVGRPEKKRSLEGSRRRCDGNIECYVQEIGWICMDWMDGA
jgi:hypothetical protein